MLRSFCLAVIISLILCVVARGDEPFLRGDTNADGTISVTDVQMFSCYLFCDFFPIACGDAADADDDGNIDISDAIAILIQVFRPESTIAPPFPQVGLDPTEDSLACNSYSVDPTGEIEKTVRLGDVEALPGERASVPLFVSQSSSFSALQIVVRYNPEQFTILPSNDETKDLFFAETYFDFSTAKSSHIIFSLLDFPEEGVCRFGFVPSLIIPDYNLELEENHVLNIVGDVSPAAEPGTVIDFAFTSHAAEFGLVQTEVTQSLEAFLPSTLIPGSITVKAPTRFVRGDSNLDGGIDISDAIHMLQFMFIGGVPMTCLDAADTNDDGASEITDSIGLLNHLFLGGLPPAAPWPGCGADLSEDTLNCGGYPECEE